MYTTAKLKVHMQFGIPTKEVIVAAIFVFSEICVHCYRVSELVDRLSVHGKLQVVCMTDCMLA